MTYTRAIRRGQAGFTLIELMTVVAIIGILASLAVGLTANWRRRNQTDNATREIFNAMNQARAYAIRQGITVQLEITATTNGRVNVFVDANNNHSYDSSESLLYQYPIDTGGPFAGQASGGTESGTWPPGMTVSFDSAITSANGTGAGNVGFILFDSSGFHVDTSGQPLAGYAQVADTVSGKTRKVDVTVAGALRIR